MTSNHWMVENHLRPVLGMVFGDDDCRVRTDDAPVNLAIDEHIALDLLIRNSSERFGLGILLENRSG